MRMRRVIALMATFFLLCGISPAQQFQISVFDRESITIEYPPCFDGAYLFIQKSTNLTGNVWEVVDYSQVSLVPGQAAQTVYALPDESSVSGSTNPVEVPYDISPEYLAAVASGEIEQVSAEESVLSSLQSGICGFFKVIGLSFVDSDGDGVDNVSEYGNGTDPYATDAPLVDLPDDDGDPRPVPGSVNSAPGDWNTQPTVYRNTSLAWKVVNNLILAMNGTTGTFTAETLPETLGAWISAHCTGYFYGNAFYRTETDSFQWAGKDDIYPLAMTAYDGSEQFVNHLIQGDPTDPAGLAVLEDGTPVLVNEDNPWTEEKLLACLKHLNTVKCRLQRLSGDTFDPTDTTAMARSIWRDGANLPVAADRIGGPINFTVNTWVLMETGWVSVGTSVSSRNQKFTFLDNLKAYGFGSTIHRGFIGYQPGYDWDYDWPCWTKWTVPTNIHSSPVTGEIFNSFTCSDGDTSWFVAGDIDYFDESCEYGDITGCPETSLGECAIHYWGNIIYTVDVLSTLDLPLVAVQTLVMDSDRDGNISTNDFGCVAETHPYRFWVNEDGNNAAFPVADLEDFFPAMLMPLPETSNVTFKLSSDIELNYIQTSMTASNSQEYLHDIDLAQTLAGQIQTLTVGNQTPVTFNANEVVLLAAVEANTNAHIMVHVLENGSETAVLTNYFSFSSVTNMYRIKNLRTNGVSSIGEPSNWPDELTNGKDFVFVHGYNVTEADGREWNNTIFKRLWLSGSYAKYHGILWDGTPPASGDKKHYHNAVVNAFATAPQLVAHLNSLNSPVVAAHSLGNMVASSAICDHDANVSQYYMLDAAVAKEAYGDTTPDENMIPDGSVIYNQNEGLFSLIGYSWHRYPFETYASEWYRLFSTSDVRSKLTWRNRFADIQQKTDVFNFYSSSEDILRVDTGYTTIVSGALHGDFGLYAFQLQELFKGKNDAIANLAGGSDPYAGWGFTTKSDTHIISTPLLNIDFWPRNPRFHHEQLDTNAANAAVRAAFLKTLKTDPLFRPEPGILFGAGAETFAAATIGTCGYTFNYGINNATVDIANVPVCDYLLAKAFPARTGPQGSRSNLKWPPTTANFDMSTTLRNPYAPVLPNNDDDWAHSAFRDYPYVNMCNLFRKLTGKELITNP